MRWAIVWKGFCQTTSTHHPDDAIALDGIVRVVGYLDRAVADGNDREARWYMLMAALEGGMSIHMGLGPVHVLGHVFADSPIHHGALIAASMPPVVRFYQARGDDALNGKLEALGYANDDLDALADYAMNVHFNATAPIRPSHAEYRDILAETLG
jgi:alcohol dehydrogenase class IV